MGSSRTSSPTRTTLPREERGSNLLALSWGPPEVEVLGLPGTSPAWPNRVESGPGLEQFRAVSGECPCSS